VLLRTQEPRTAHVTLVALGSGVRRSAVQRGRIRLLGGRDTSGAERAFIAPIIAALAAGVRRAAGPDQATLGQFTEKR
jgi:hypothetical protein